MFNTKIIAHLVPTQHCSTWGVALRDRQIQHSCLRFVLIYGNRNLGWHKIVFPLILIFIIEYCNNLVTYNDT